MAELLDDQQIEARLGELKGWARDADKITKSYDRGDFVGAVDFVRRIVDPAEELGHHPDLGVSAGAR